MTITTNTINKKTENAKLQVARLEMLADQLGINLDKELDQVFSALNRINLRLEFTATSADRGEKYMKITDAGQKTRFTGKARITKREYFKTSYKKLEKALGAPLGSTESSHFEWAFISATGDVFTIYDYSIKDGVQTISKNGLQAGKEFKWRIGAKWTANVQAFIDWLNNKIV